ncbi:MAG: ribosome maturation factor RimP [Acidobacteriota bacterium]
MTDRPGGILMQIEDLADSIALSLGLALYDVDYRRSGPRSKLLLFIDRSDGGVTLDDCERFSRQISRELDVLDLIPDSYDLEVSSPGIDRQIRTKRHWHKAVGAKVKLRHRDAAGRAQTETATVLAVADEEVRLRRLDQTEFTVQLGSVQTARMHIDY